MSVSKHLAVLFISISIGCAGSTAPSEGVVTITDNTVPVPLPLTAGTIVAQPAALGLASATLYTFSVTPSGGKAPYVGSWNFGDGTAPATGDKASHLYTNTGDFTVVATVMDAEGKSAKAERLVMARGVSGRWVVEFENTRRDIIDLVQNGSAVAAVGAAGSGAGSVSNPYSLSFSLNFGLPNQFPPYVVTYVGTLDPAETRDATLSTWKGTATASGYPGCPCPFTATRR